MNDRFLLPCQCGQSVTVQISQAGQTLTCACGRPLTVPTLRGIRQLQPATDAPAKSVKVSNWSATKGALFAGGILLILLGLAISLFYYPHYSHTAAVKPSDEEMNEFLARIDESSPEDMWEIWHVLSEHGLGEHTASHFVQFRMISRRFRNFVLFGAALMGTGAIMVVAPLFMPGKKKSS